MHDRSGRRIKQQRADVKRGEMFVCLGRVSSFPALTEGFLESVGPRQLPNGLSLFSEFADALLAVRLHT